jgi:hypothetical protein
LILYDFYYRVFYVRVTPLDGLPKSRLATSQLYEYLFFNFWVLQFKNWIYVTISMIDYLKEAREFTYYTQLFLLYYQVWASLYIFIDLDSDTLLLTRPSLYFESLDVSDSSDSE